MSAAQTADTSADDRRDAAVMAMLQAPESPLGRVQGPEGVHPDAYGLVVDENGAGPRCPPGSIVIVEPLPPAGAGLAVFYRKDRPPTILDLTRNFRPYLLDPVHPDSEVTHTVEAIEPVSGRKGILSISDFEKVHRVIAVNIPPEVAVRHRVPPSDLPEMEACPEGFGEYLVGTAEAYPVVRLGETVIVNPGQRDPTDGSLFLLQWRNGSRSALMTNFRSAGSTNPPAWWVVPVNRPTNCEMLGRRAAPGEDGVMIAVGPLHVVVSAHRAAYDAFQVAPDDEAENTECAMRWTRSLPRPARSRSWPPRCPMAPGAPGAHPLVAHRRGPECGGLRPSLRRPAGAHRGPRGSAGARRVMRRAACRSRPDRGRYRGGRHGECGPHRHARVSRRGRRSGHGAGGDRRPRGRRRIRGRVGDNAGHAGGSAHPGPVLRARRQDLLPVGYRRRLSRACRHRADAVRPAGKPAGWPDAVWNMDSRAGAVSEAFEAGAEPADVMRAATHTQMSTTMLYNRGSVVQSGRVAELRAARRRRSEQGRNETR